ncbi:MAG: response regulator [Anaerocolumna sp.]
MYKVLIVDDEPIVKIALRSIISWENYGYTISATASDGIEALKLIHEIQPDLIITDLKMPNMDGLTLIRELKNISYPGEILVLSNYEDFDYVRSALVMGAVDYLLKISIQDTSLIQYLDKISGKLALSKTQNTIAEQYERILKDQQRKKRQQILKDYFESLNDLAKLSPEDTQLTEDMLISTYDLILIHFKENSVNSKGGLSQESIQNTLFEAFDAISGYELLFINKANVIVFFPSSARTGKTINILAYLQKLSSLFQLYFSVLPVIVFKEKITGMEKLREWYHTSEKITELVFYEELRVIKAEDYLPLHYINFVYYVDFAEELQKNYPVDFNKCKVQIRSLLEEFKNKHILPEVAKTYFEKSIEMLEYLNHNLSLQTHKYLMEMKEHIKVSCSLEDLYLYITMALEAIFAPISTTEKNQAEYKDEIVKAINYINQNYHRKISLTSLSDYVNLSSGYLCRLFKSEVGISITNYINGLRMKKAMELIKNQEKEVALKEIAISIGIDDQLYFSRLFRKYYGMAPSEYKQ